MAKVTYGSKNLTRYQELLLHRERRRAMIDEGLARSDVVRNLMSININKTASDQVQSSEMQLRAKAQAATKAKMEKFNKLA